MNFTPLALAALAALLTTPLAAQTITRSCAYKGDGKLGPLTINFDEAAHTVRVTTQDGRIYRYQDGVTGRISPASSQDDLGPVEQFVKYLPDEVEVGFRWIDDGSTGHLAYFDRAAFKDPAKPCLWRSLWNFAMG
ncbi:MAG TPA: hypothetical protein VFE63_17500 [Roseiarcus sp.]|jgi:hypothetical protein|nr:hypothetical protein [Roseiarcus sp.]